MLNLMKVDFLHTYAKCGSTFNLPGNNFSNLCNHGSSGP